MTRRRKVVDIYNTPLTPAKTTPGLESTKEFYARTQREEQEWWAAEQTRIEAERMAPVRAIERELKQAAKEQSEKIAAFYSKPLAVIAGAGVDVAPSDPVYGDYPLQDGPKDAAADAAAYREFKSDLANRGCTLTDAGWQRLGGYLSALHYNRNISLASASSWAIGLKRMASLSVFYSGELNNYQRQPATKRPAVQPVRPESFDELLHRTSTESRADRHELLEALKKEKDRVEIPIFREWAAHLSRDYGFTLSQEDATYILEALFPKNNWSFAKGESYNMARRAMVAQHKWPSTMLTEVERLTQELESIPSTDYFKYREAKQRLRNAEAAAKH